MLITSQDSARADEAIMKAFDGMSKCALKISGFITKSASFFKDNLRNSHAKPHRILGTREFARI